jgi:uncharacterized membrane protein
VPSLGVTLAGFFLAAGVLLFLVFLNRSIHRLRPVAVAALVAQAGRRSFLDVLREVEEADAPVHVLGAYVSETPPMLVVPSLRAGAVQALDTTGLTRFARERDCVVVIRPAVGDFVPEGAALFEVYGAGALDDAAAGHLRSMIVLGVERTIEQDPAFAIRVMVDIAIRALSPAVNDPTTAVQVLDHLGETLRFLGVTGRPAPDMDGSQVPSPALVVRARGWDDVVELAFTEIREYGGSSVQVVRRLRALLEDLRERVKPEYRAAVDDELRRLDATVDKHWRSSVDLDRARQPDAQGIGGPPVGRPAGPDNVLPGGRSG